MPLYVYRCSRCDEPTEVRRPIADRDKSVGCSKCGAPEATRVPVQPFSASGASETTPELEPGRSRHSNISISDFSFKDVGGYGIRAEGVDGLSISNGRIHNARRGGIHVTDSSFEVDRVTIEND